MGRTGCGYVHVARLNKNLFETGKLRQQQGLNSDLEVPMGHLSRDLPLNIQA